MFYRWKGLLLLLLVISALYFTGEKIILSGANFFLHSYFEEKLFSHFSTENGKLSKGGLIFDGVKLQHPSGEKVEIKSVQLKPHWKDYSLLPQFKVAMSEPTFYVKENSIIFSPQEKSKFSHLDIDIKNGKLFLKKEDQSEKMILFSLLHNVEKTDLEANFPSSSLLLHKRGRGDDYLLDLTLDQIELDDVAFLVQSFGFKIAGNLTGTIHLKAKEGVFKSGKVDCRVTDLRMSQENKKIYVQDAEVKAGFLDKDMVPPLYSFCFGETFFPASFRLKLDGGEAEIDNFKMSSLEGFVSHESSLGLKIEISGQLEKNKKVKTFTWEGKGYFTSPFQNWLETNVTFKGEEESSFLLQAEEIDPELAELKVSTENISFETGSFFLSLLGDRFQQIDGIEWQKGSLSFASVFHFWQRKLTSFEAVFLEGSDLYFFDPQRHLTVSASHLDAKGECFLEELNKSTLTLNMEGGNLRAEDSQKRTCEVNNLFCSIQFSHQRFLNSYLELLWNRRPLEMHLYGSLEEMWLSFQMKGGLQEMTLFSKGQEPLSDEEVKGDLILRKTHSWEIAGGLQFQSGRESSDSWNISLGWKEGTLEGRILGQKIQFNRYSSLFKQEDLEVKGEGNVELSLGNNALSLSLSAQDLSLKTSLFNCHFPEIQKENFSFVYHLIEKTKSLTLSFKNAQGFLPSLNLAFEKIQGNLFLDEGLLNLQVEKMLSEGLLIGGEILFDQEKELLSLRSNYLEGSIENGKKFFRHFNKSFFTTLPMCGKLISPPEGFYFSMEKKDKPLWGLTLFLSEGIMPLGPFAKLQDFHATMHWDSTNDSMQMWDAEGVFSLKDENLKLSFPLFEISQENQCSFDLRLKKPSWDVLSLSGSFTTENINEEHALLTFSFGPKCSLFGAHLDIPTFVSYDLDEVKKIELKTSCSLLSFLLSAEFIGKMGNLLPDISLEQESLEGKVAFHLRHGFPDSYIECRGESLHILGKEIKEAGLTARLSKDALFVDKCYWDEAVSSFVLEKKNDLFKLSNIETKWKDTLQISSEAQYLGNKKLDCKIKKFTLQLEEVEAFQEEFFPIAPLHGNLSGIGHLSMQWVDGKPDWEADLDLLASDLKYHDLAIKNRGELHLFHSTKAGLKMLGIDLVIEPKKEGLSFAECKVGLCSQEKRLDKWQLKDFSLELPQDALGFIQTIQNFSLPPIAKEFFSSLSSVHLQGDASFASDLSTIEISLPELSLPNLQMERFPYIKQKLQRLSKVSLYHSKNHLLFSASFPEINEKFRGILSLNTSSDYGKLFLLEENQASFPLAIYWHIDPSLGLNVSQIEGEFSGLDASFYEVNENMKSLNGSLKVDFSKACRLFPENVLTLLTKYKLGDGYELKGTLSREPDFLFKGICIGKDFEILNCKLKTFLGDLDFSFDHLVLKDFKVSDSALMLNLPSLKIKKDTKGIPRVYLPHLDVEEFRPSLIKKLGEKQKEIEPFVIRKLQLDDVRGNLLDAKSFTGKGNFSFINSFKREYTVFDVPSDVLGRLFGLDLELLVPVQGSMEYIIKDGKVQFTSLKECYSENKRSKFFLLDKDIPYLDFDGNISLNIKMKQYVLFKFTEQFILNIGGNLADPTFQLKRKKSFLPQLGL